ncbi:MAG TPA: 6-phosphogluconolactonase [Candidatus Acidoferrales bacterium]|nr:6-phosphogluconolactonase [Candidatus Acidoferrales bacterium]
MSAFARPQLVILDNESMLAEMLARSFLSEAALSIASRGVFTVALAGGSTPKSTYALLASPVYRHALEWGRVHFFFGDERCVPPDHPDSNYRMVNESLFMPLGISPETIFRMRGEDEPGAAAASYAQTLIEQLGPTPSLDLVMLGMGPDGHTASLFPGQPPDDSSDLVRVRIAPPTMRVAQRLTMTPRVINAGREVLVATAGEAKAQTLARVLEGPYDPVNLPIQIVQPSSGRLTWLVDRAAASLLHARSDSSS